jgi:hypothetical protein
MSKNKLYTLSYFRQRLFAAGIESKILIKKYIEEDSRYWTISIFKDKCIFCTCFKNNGEPSFEFWDGANYVKNKTTIRTKSMNVIIQSLLSWSDTEPSV